MRTVYDNGFGKVTALDLDRICERSLHRRRMDSPTRVLARALFTSMLRCNEVERHISQTAIAYTIGDLATHRDAVLENRCKTYIYGIFSSQVAVLELWC